MAEPTGARRVPVAVTVDAADLREWAGRHADSGHHGVAHVLYQAAEGVESITEQHDREVAARALDEAADALVQWLSDQGDVLGRDAWSDGVCYGVAAALGDRVDRMGRGR